MRAMAVARKFTRAAGYRISSGASESSPMWPTDLGLPSGRRTRWRRAQGPCVCPCATRRDHVADLAGDRSAHLRAAPLALNVAGRRETEKALVAPARCLTRTLFAMWRDETSAQATTRPRPEDKASRINRRHGVTGRCVPTRSSDWRRQRRKTTGRTGSSETTSALRSLNVLEAPLHDRSSRVCASGATGSDACRCSAA